MLISSDSIRYGFVPGQYIADEVSFYMEQFDFLVFDYEFTLDMFDLLYDLALDIYISEILL